ncbi:MAG TPA: TIGR03936 family radical SAM-associated protein [Patescibacteria group bacterium]|nr:TIGR03936 family radical SAM-associated protein [Patescibacteria group bacterium]
MTQPSGAHRGLSTDSAAPGPNPAPPAPARQRWRLFVALPASAGLDATADPGETPGRPALGWPALLAASGLPLAGEEGGRGRVAAAAALPVGVAGEREVVDVYLSERLPARVVRAAVVAALPAGRALVDLHDVWLGAPSAPSAVVAADYRVLLEGPPRWAIEGAVLALLGATALPRERRREKRTTVYDLRPLILRLEVRTSDGTGVMLAMRLRHASDAVGRPDEVVAALGEPPAPPLPVAPATRSVVRERILMVGDPDVAGSGRG